MARFDKLPPKDEYKKMQAEKEKEAKNNKPIIVPKPQIRVQKVPVPGKQIKNLKGGASNGE